MIVGAIHCWRPEPLEPAQILQWVMIACIVLWLVMMAILLAVLAIASTIPREMRQPQFNHDRRLMAVAMAHQYEYVLGAIALLAIAVMTWRYQLRGKLDP